MATLAEHRGPWRFDELADLPDDDRRYEVVDGRLVVSPAPGQRLQAIGAELLFALRAQCPPAWRVCYEFALPMGTDGRVPDLAVVHSAADLGGPSPYPLGPESFGLVVEVVSPSSRKTDRFAKPGEYAEAGIALFWRVETEPSVVVHAFELRAGAYVEVARVSSEGDVPVPWGNLRLAVPQL